MVIIETLSQLLRRLRNNERGVTTVEYAIMLVLVGIAVATFGLGLSTAVTSVFSRMISHIAIAS